jgi:hypothetical protein
MKNIRMKYVFSGVCALAGLFAQAAVLSDFQRPTPDTKTIAVKWQAYSDQIARGNSTADYRIEQEGHNSYLRLTGTLAAGFFYPYAGVQMLWESSRRIQGLPQAQGVRFRAKGDNKVYRLQLLLSSVQDHNEYSIEFSPNAEWRPFEVRFDQLKQAGWGQQVTWDPAKIRGVGFHIDGGVMPFELALDDLELF